MSAGWPRLPPISDPVGAVVVVLAGIRSLAGVWGSSPFSFNQCSQGRYGASSAYPTNDTMSSTVWAMTRGMTRFVLV